MGINNQLPLLSKIFVGLLHQPVRLLALIFDPLDLVVLLVEIVLVVKQPLASIHACLHVCSSLSGSIG